MKNSKQRNYPSPLSNSPSHSKKVLIGGFITTVLIMLMLIPMVLIQNMVTEKKQRKKEVYEASSKLAIFIFLKRKYVWN